MLKDLYVIQIKKKVKGENMKVKLHNKYEIMLGDKTYLAYNTITKGIFDAIYNFQNYGKGIAVGDGITELGYESSKLSNFVQTLPAQIEEMQCDPSKGTLYIKRTASSVEIGEEFDITELGITDSNQTQLEGNIYSHAYIKDESGKRLTIHKDADVDLFIRYTMYLELDDTKTFLTAGNNLLVKAIFGALQSTPTISVVRGQNSTPNGEFVHRNAPNTTKKYSVKTSRISQEDNTETIRYAFDAKSGEICELVLLFDSTPVARYCMVGQGTQVPTELENLVTQKNYTLDLGQNVAQVVSVADQSGEIVSGYKTRQYARDFSDWIDNPFEANFTSECARWVSNDGNKLAFVADGTLYIYLNKNYAIYKISHNISSVNLKKIIMFENCIFAIYDNQTPLKMYKIGSSLVATQVNVDLSAYNQFSSSYDWQEIQIIGDGNQHFAIGIVLGVINRKAVLLKATLSSDTLTIDSAEYCKADYVVHSFSLYKNNFCDSLICFVTNNYKEIEENYRIEQISPDYTSKITNEIPAYYLSTAVSVEGKSRAVVAKMAEKPFIWLYYYPQAYRYSISLTEGVQNWISTNLMYIIQKYDDSQTPYKIYSLNDYNNPQEFAKGFPEQLDLSTVVDFEFLDDTLIIFTTTKTYALNLKINQTILENMPATESSYNVNIIKEQLAGTNPTEGVMGWFDLVFKV